MKILRDGKNSWVNVVVVLCVLSEVFVCVGLFMFSVIGVDEGVDLV